VIRLVFVIVTISYSLTAQNPPQPSGGSVAIPVTRTVNPIENGKKSTPVLESSCPDLRIGPGDLIDIKVYGAPELTMRVSNGGEITMSPIGAMKVAGLNPEEIQKQIERRLLDGGGVRDPHVNFLVEESASQAISVLGEVTRSGIFPVLGSRRLFDAHSAARNVRIIRQVAGNSR